MATWYKESQTKRLPDFTSVDVRRLSGILHDFKDLSGKAIEEMDQWIGNGEYDISLDEAYNRLLYYMSRMGIKK